MSAYLPPGCTVNDIDHSQIPLVSKIERAMLISDGDEHLPPQREEWWERVAQKLAHAKTRAANLRRELAAAESEIERLNALLERE